MTRTPDPRRHLLERPGGTTLGDVTTARLRVCMRLTTSAEKPKVAALRANTTAGGLNSSSRPAMAGPTMIERFSTADCALLAAARCSSPTTAGVVARAAGSYDEVVTDVRAASTIARTTGPFSAATTASAVWKESASRIERHHEAHALDPVSDRAHQTGSRRAR